MAENRLCRFRVDRKLWIEGQVLSRKNRRKDIRSALLRIATGAIFLLTILMTEPARSLEPGANGLADQSVRLDKIIESLTELLPPSSTPLSQPENKNSEFYEFRIRPVLSENCFGCHGTEKQKSSLRLDSIAAILKGGEHGAALVPGDPEKSRLILAIRYDSEPKMPPKAKLPQQAIDDLTAWVKQGAPGFENAGEDSARKAAEDRVAVEMAEKRWAFRPVSNPAVPEIQNTNWVINPIDAFVAAKLQTASLHPSPPAAKPALIRRIYFDMLGLPPTFDEVQEFVRDTSPDAYDKLVERVLASPRYGERWARHWLDVVRFAETNGFETNVPRGNAWPYRDYVIRSLNEDKPYSQFIFEQLAGDSCGADAATGYLVGGPSDEVKSPDIELTMQQRMDELHDMVSTTGSTFLGLTIGCARCHDHKFDPILQKDYYAMQAVFAGVQHGPRSLKPPDYEERMKEAVKVKSQIAVLEQSLGRFIPLANPSLFHDVILAEGQGKAEFSKLTAGLHLRRPVHPQLNIDRFTPVEARFLRFTILETNTLEPCIDELEVFSSSGEPRNVALASNGARATTSGTFPNAAIHKLEHINEGLYGNSHSWISDQAGKGWVQIEFPDKVTIDRVVWARDREGVFKDRLATQYRIEVTNDPTDSNAWKTVASSEHRGPFIADKPIADDYSAAELSAVDAEELLFGRVALKKARDSYQSLITMPQIYAGTFTQPGPTHRLNRGDAMQKLETVNPGAIEAAGAILSLQKDMPEQQRRLALAKWIASPENPFTARVMVNRIWHYHFGTGIVNTPSDFGANGARPTHPELLDWLAGQFVQTGWSIKVMHGLILRSNTYRQSSAPVQEALAVDANDRFLWRFPPQRLEAEAIRDTVLATSGKLDLTMGGPGFDVFEPNSNYVHVYIPKREFGPPEWRRMIYQFKPRMRQDETFGVFDCPDGAQVAPKRTRSTTPLQSLNLLNSPFMMQQADFFAQRVMAASPTDVENQVKVTFHLALDRDPDLQEAQAASGLVRAQGLTVLCRAMFNTNEFIYVN